MPSCSSLPPSASAAGRPVLPSGMPNEGRPAAKSSSSEGSSASKPPGPAGGSARHHERLAALDFGQVPSAHATPFRTVQPHIPVNFALKQHKQASDMLHRAHAYQQRRQCGGPRGSKAATGLALAPILRQLAWLEDDSIFYDHHRRNVDAQCVRGAQGTHRCRASCCTAVRPDSASATLLCLQRIRTTDAHYIVLKSAEWELMEGKGTWQERGERYCRRTRGARGASPPLIRCWHSPEFSGSDACLR